METAIVLEDYGWIEKLTIINATEAEVWNALR